MYFLYGTNDPSIKFQVSLKYQIFNPKGSWAQAAPWIEGFHLAYTQTSFWDIAGESKPFFDSSYRPELLWLYDQPDPHWLPGKIGTQPGEHLLVRVLRPGPEPNQAIGTIDGADRGICAEPQSVRPRNRNRASWRGGQRWTLLP